MGILCQEGQVIVEHRLNRHCQSAEPKAAPAASEQIVLGVCQLSGTVVPAVQPLNVQKLLSASCHGKTSPTMSVLLVPSVTEAMRTNWPVA